MTAQGFALFDTSIGHCAIAWNARGIAGAQLPERDEAASRARMLRRFPGAPELPVPPGVQSAVDAIGALLRGEDADLSTVVLDMEAVPDFNRRVYEIARGIPPGSTLTYGDIATRLGDVTLARAVGQSLGNNPFAPIVPCHRVLSANGKMHGFSAGGGVATKLRMLTTEGWRAEQPTLFG
ncbi:MAG: methylated-DNA-[protein]-cysteine S-methyltransferase [Candidatus Eremiobacteraeota bacterium]|nr:methylated-DNA-[protein]-cysteine S-methyltransferase [Candidatus Eremiobacteraeota bacterium]